MSERIQFIAIPYHVFTDPGLTHAEKLAIGRLMLYARGGRCFPSHGTLARELCISARQAQRLLASLKQKGWLEWQRTGKSNEYALRDCHGCHDMSRTAGQQNPENPDNVRTSMSDQPDSHEPDRTRMSDQPEPDRTRMSDQIGHKCRIRSDMDVRQKEEGIEEGKDTHTPAAADARKRVCVSPKTTDYERKPKPRFESAAAIIENSGLAKGSLAPSERFEEVWNRWPRKEQRDRAHRDWNTYVTVENESAVMACADRYLASGEVARGVVKHFSNWLKGQHQDNWEGTWPAPPKSRTQRINEALEDWHPRESRTAQINRVLGIEE